MKIKKTESNQLTCKHCSIDLQVKWSHHRFLNAVSTESEQVVNPVWSCVSFNHDLITVRQWRYHHSAHLLPLAREVHHIAQTQSVARQCDHCFPSLVKMVVAEGGCGLKHFLHSTFKKTAAMWNLDKNKGRDTCMLHIDSVLGGFVVAV